MRGIHHTPDKAIIVRFLFKYSQRVNAAQNHEYRTQQLEKKLICLIYI